MKKRITREVEARLDEVARMKASMPSFRRLSAETGLTAGYLRQLVSVRVQAITNKCDGPRGTTE